MAAFSKTAVAPEASSKSGSTVGSARTGLTARELVKSTGSAVIFPDHSVIFQPACSYCKLSFQEGDICRSTLCDHAFHASCMEDYFSRHRRCPACRCKLGSRSNRSSPALHTPCWSPDYDSELMRISTASDLQFRETMLSERGRSLPPRSTLFLGAGTVLPVVREEDDAAPWVVRDADPSRWTPEMRRLAVAFVVSLARMHVAQATCLAAAIKIWRAR